MKTKFKTFLEKAKEISEEQKLLEDVSLFPLISFRIQDKILKRIEKLKKELPKLTNKEKEELYNKYKYDIIKFGVCVCGGELRKLKEEIYCLECDRFYYEE